MVKKSFSNISTITCISLTFLSISFSVKASEVEAREVYSLIQVQNDRKNVLRTLLVEGFDLVRSDHLQYYQVVANQSDLQRLQELGFNYIVQIHDMSAFYEQRLQNESLDLVGGYPTYAETNDSLWLYRSLRPDIVSIPDTIGFSIQNRPILMIKISDNPNVDENEPEVFYNSMIHSREMITHTLLMYFIRYLINNYNSDARVQNIVNNRELYFVLTVNPDGMVYNETSNPNGGGMWRKNRRVNPNNSRGVDLNRNFGFMWGYDNFGSSPVGNSETYRGTGPFSEPETQAIRDFMNGRQFRITLNYHSYSNFYVYPISYRRIYAPDHLLLHNLALRMNVVNNYQVGQPWWLLYPVNGDAPDWQYNVSPDSLKNFAYVVEVGTQEDGFWPPLSRVPILCQENLEANLRAAELAAEPRIVLPPSKPILLSPDTIQMDLPIEWMVPNSTINIPVSYDFRATDYFPIGVETFDNNLNNIGWLPMDVTITTTQFHSGYRSFQFLNQNNARSMLVSAHPYQVQHGDTLKYWLKYDIESDYDYFFAQISTDGGTTWMSLRGDRTDTTNPNGLNWDHGITGTSNNVWVRCKHPLQNFVGNDVYFRFVYILDGGTVEDGVWIDDIEPSILTSNPWTLNFTNITQSSLQLNQSGEWYVQVRATDAENDKSLWSNLRKFVLVANNAKNETQRIPFQFAITKIYPNPFNHSISIHYTIPFNTNVIIQLYALDGRQIATLSQKFHPTGTYNINWKAPNELSSGMYWLVLSNEQHRIMKKVLFIK
ncbi:MAG: M14 family zinc carboxypeptidase [bacterium]|nr:M14 family zinc carboxypeptidase [bacterium]